MPSTHLLGIASALASALVWGSGDFSGGMAARRSHPFQVLALAAGSGIVMLVGLALLRGEALPTAGNALWSALAGLSGAVGIAALYAALAQGNAAVVAPAAAVVSAAVPVLFQAVYQGLPQPARLTGFGLALAGLWLVAAPAPDSPAALPARPAADPARGLGLGLLAGIGFGGFFVFLGQVDEGTVFAPLVVARTASLAGALVMLRARGVPLPGPASNPIALLAGLLDAGGNVFFFLAQQLTRLDVAAVLSSLYPVTTVLLARVVLREQVAPRQWAGATLCFVAVALISA